MLRCCSAPPRKRVVFLGLERSGKSRLCAQLVSGGKTDDDAAEYKPTTLPMVSTCRVRGKQLVVWDLPGADQQTWRHFYTGAAAICFVMDTTSTANETTIVRDLLVQLASEDQLKHTAILLVCNSHGGGEASLAMGAEVQALFASRHFKLCTDKEFAQEGLEWLCKVI